MKKSALVVFVLLTAILFAVSSCSATDTKELVGTWSSSCDIAELINEGLADSAGEYAEYFKIDSFNVVLFMTFSDDGYYTLKADEKLFVETFDSVRPVFENGVRKMYEDTAASMGITLDELLLKVGRNLDEITAEVTSGMDPASMASSLSFEGQYSVRDGKLFTSDARDVSPSKSEYETYELTDDGSLIFKSCVGDSSEESIFTYPIEFKKTD